MTCVDPHSIGGQHPMKIYLESASMDDLATEIVKMDKYKHSECS